MMILSEFILEKWIVAGVWLKSVLNVIVRPFICMPLVLKLIVLHSLACIVFVYPALFPEHSINANANEIMQTTVENGKLLWYLLSGVMLPICGILILLKYRYSRHLYILLSTSTTVVKYSFPLNISLIIFDITFVLGLIWYLFFKSTVREYYRL